jgi:hypothetical protein
MTDEQINEAIAEACGWKEITNCTCGGKKRGCPPGGHASSHTPDYCNDLNAMHEAEKTLTRKHFKDYLMELLGFIDEPILATARWRAEAFLLTLGKWEEAK